MFFKETKAVNAVVTATAPLVRGLPAIMGDNAVPNGFWRDPYVLGFLNATMIIHAKIASRGKLNGTDLNRVLLLALKELVGIDYDFVANYTVELARSKHPDFTRGLKSGDKCACVAHGDPAYNDDPDVIEAKRRAPSLAQISSSLELDSSADTATSSALLSMLYYDVLRKKFYDSLSTK